MNQVKILIVEDDVISARIIKKILLTRGYEITDVISNSNYVIDAIHKNTPDLILMDIIINGEKDGIEIAEIIKKEKDIPIIYLTSDSSEGTIQRAKITEPFGYLIKPINEKVLLTNIELTLFKQNEQNKRNIDALRKANDELEKKVIERTKELLDKNELLLIENKQRIQAEESLKKSERLATIGKMSAILAHEIRNPLNSIKINTDILLTTLNNPGESTLRRLQIIKKEVNRLDELLKEVLQFSRISTLIKTDFNLHDFAESLINQLTPEFKSKNIILKNEVMDINIYADKERLKQVSLNLLINAFDASPENGEITVSSEVEGDSIKIYFMDTGFGVTNSENIFDPFFTTKPSGTGLGLSISQNIIEQHDGSLSLVKSKPGETVFCIKLPILIKN